MWRLSTSSQLRFEISFRPTIRRLSVVVLPISLTRPVNVLLVASPSVDDIEGFLAAMAASSAPGFSRAHSFASIQF